MKIKSVARRNIVILLLSLMPFIIGISVSIANSSDLEYFGTAINISGSQRMRTMLIANYSQQYENAYINGEVSEINEIKGILEKEIGIYEKYMSALVSGDESINMKHNGFQDIVNKINSLRPLFDSYTESATKLIYNPTDEDSLLFIK